MRNIFNAKTYNYRSKLWLPISLLLVTLLLSQLVLGTTVANVQAAVPNTSNNTSSDSGFQPPAPVRNVGQPTTDPHLPNLALQTTFSDDQISVGDIITATLTLTNSAPDPANNVVVSLPLPAGAMAVVDKNTQADGQGWSWSLNNLAGGTWNDKHATLSVGPAATFTATMLVNTMPAGEALLLQPQVTATGLTAPIKTTGGVLVLDPAKTGTATTNFLPGSDTTLSSSDGHVVVRMPAAATTKNLTLSHNKVNTKSNQPIGDVSNNTTSTPPPFVGKHKSFGTFLLNAKDGQGNAVHQFDKPISIKVSYTLQQLAALHISEPDLSLFWYDDSHVATYTDNQGKQQQVKGQWLTVPTDIDATNHTITATVNHFSGYTLGDGSSPSSEFIPSLQGFQADLYTGAASYNYPIEVPAGPSGIKPQVSLSYSSAATDGPSGQRPLSQGGWVGKGWSLDTGSIAVNRLSDGSRYYSLVMNGQSYDLVEGEYIGSNPNPSWTTQYAWRSTNESFMKVRAISDYNTPWSPNRWDVWTKDGTMYEFAEQSQWAWDCSMPYPGFDPYKWQLSSVTDTHGNRITYKYLHTTNNITLACNNQSGNVDWDTIPYTISWGTNIYDSNSRDRYQVGFVAYYRGNDTAYDLDSNQAGGTPHQTRYLQNILVQSNQSNPYDPGAWQQISQYQLTYDYSLYSDAYYDQNGFIGQVNTAYPKLTLKTIQRWGSDNTLLPATTFGYNTNRGSNVNYISGGWNRLNSVNNGQGGVLTLNYDNIGANLNLSNFRNNHRITSRTETTGSGQSYNQTYTWTYSYGNPAYNSLGSAINGGDTHQYPNSASLYTSWYYSNQSLAVHPQWSEFRGHNYVYVTDPNGNQTRHWFYQGDSNYWTFTNGYQNACNPQRANISNDSCYDTLINQEFLKGKEYLTQVLNGTNVFLSNTWHNFVVDFDFNTGTPASGLWHAFSYESQTIFQNYEGGGTAINKYTDYNYDYNPNAYPDGLHYQYGNLIRQEDHDGNNNLYRATTHYYVLLDNGSSYNVNHEWGSSIQDSQNRYLAVTHNFYDNGSLNSINGPGNLTLVRKYYDIPLTSSLSNQTYHASDTSYGYDLYGNLTSSTIYAGSGYWVYNTGGMSGPGNGSTGWTTTTTYDPMFHAFSTQTSQQVGNGINLTQTAGYDYRMGTLTSITDPNNNTTTATYDVFGRLASVIKPGDSVQYPTFWMVYNDGSQPVEYTVAYRPTAGSPVNRPITRYYDGLGREIQTKADSGQGYQDILTDKQYDGLGQVTRTSQPCYANQNPNNGTFWGYTAIGAATDCSGNWTTTTYDGAGRVVTTTMPDNTRTYNQYWLNGSPAGPSVTTFDANNHATNRTSDVFGRLLQVVEYSGNGGSGGSYNVYASTNYSYNPLDQLTQVVDAQNHQTNMVYDTLGRKTQMGDPDMGYWQYAYDPNGNLTGQTDAKGQTITFAYDALNRMTRKYYPSGSGQGQVNYNYDETSSSNGQGQLTSIGNTRSISSYQYDARGRKTSQTTGLPNYPTANNQRTFGWSYDSGDRVSSITYPTGEVVSYGYNAAWEQTSLCSNQGGPCYIQNASYSALNQMTSQQYGNNQIQTWLYSGPMQRLAQIKIGDSSGNPSGLGGFFNRSYSYDNVGNLTGIGDNALCQSQVFSYDERDRLTNAHTTNNCGNSTAGYSTGVSYDQIGNITHKDGVGDYHYDPNHAHQLSNVTGTSYSNCGYGYDANGNVGYGGCRNISWNADNQPTSVQIGSWTESYLYDGNGERISRTVNNGQTTWFVGGIWEEDGTGVTRSLYQLNGQVVAQRSVIPAGVNQSYIEKAALANATAGPTTAKAAFSISATPTALVKPNSKGAIQPNVCANAIGGGGDKPNLGGIGGGGCGTPPPPPPPTATPMPPPPPTVRVVYIHSDQLGSASVVTDSNGAVLSQQDFDPWGSIRTGLYATGTIGQTDVNYTGQVLDGSGLLYYHARYYDPFTSRFVSPDSVVPGTAMGKGGALTVDFHEPVFISNQDKFKGGPTNPQNLNRYSYATNNPLIHTDPTGHVDEVSDPGGGSGNGFSDGGLGSSSGGDSGADAGGAGDTSGGSGDASGSSGWGSSGGDSNWGNTGDASTTSNGASTNSSDPATNSGDTGSTNADYGDADTYQSGKNLAKSLASEAQMAGDGTAMTGPDSGGGKPFRNAQQAADDYGGDPSNYQKMTSSTYKNDGSGYGTKIETHWIQNTETGERYEYKTKVMDDQSSN